MCLEEELYLSDLYFFAIFADLIIGFVMSAVCSLYPIVIVTFTNDKISAVNEYENAAPF